MTVVLTQFPSVDKSAFEVPAKSAIRTARICSNTPTERLQLSAPHDTLQVQTKASGQKAESRSILFILCIMVSGSMSYVLAQCLFVIVWRSNYCSHCLYEYCTKNSSSSFCYYYFLLLLSLSLSLLSLLLSLLRCLALGPVWGQGGGAVLDCDFTAEKNAVQSFEKA